MDRTQPSPLQASPRFPGLYPEQDPYESGWMRVGGAPNPSTTSIRGVRPIRRASLRWCCTAARAGQSTRPCGAFFDPESGTSPVRPARLRPFCAPMRRWTTKHHLGPDRRHRTAARAAWRREMDRVRRVLGVRPLPWPTPSPIPSGSKPWCCAALPADRPRAALVSTRTGPR